MKLQYIILGAGPTGLATAHALIERGLPKDQLIVIDKAATAGGLCRSEEIDGAPLDIGGGHFLDVQRPQVLDFLFRFMPEHEWNTFQRVSRIRLRGQEIDHPLEANLWQFSVADQVDYLDSIAQAGCVGGAPTPKSFEDWVVWKLGSRIANEYMLPYNRKIWSMDLSKLGTYWLHKLPDVSFRETLRSCLENKAFGALPAHGKFLYPKQYGYGEVWRRMGEALEDRLITNCRVHSIDLPSRAINGFWQADTIINTIPWTLWPGFCDINDEISKEIEKLQNVAIDVDYVPDTLENPSHWIYEPDESIAHHRLLLRSNFYPMSRGYWTETSATRSTSPVGWRHHNDFAYPVNTQDKPKAIAKILAWAATHNVVGIGRWGKWEHMNSDVAVAEALTFVGNLYTNGARN